MGTTIHFHKMHGLGNDFAVIDAVKTPFHFSHAEIQQLAHRHTGIGFNQLLIVRASEQADFACQIFNADGSEAEQCGNGLRCVTRFIQQTGLSEKKSLMLETKAGIFPAKIGEDNLIEITMGIPVFVPEKIPFDTSAAEKSAETIYRLHGLEDNLPFTVLSMGNPHAILCVEAVSGFPVAKLGQQLAVHSAFPQGVNVGFMEIIDHHSVRLRTFERGVGETFACGSNACATVVAGILNHSLANKVNVNLPFGNLWIEWAGQGHPVKMIGPAELVFEGSFAAK